MASIQDTKFWNVWRLMKDRCFKANNPNYKHYGGRGIGVCERWMKYKNFEDDMYDSYVYHGYDQGFYGGEEGHNNHTTIERIDNDKGYSPENCRWATNKEQQKNRRPSSRSYQIEINGKTESLNRWCLIYNIKYQTAMYRIKKLKWDFVKAITTPVIKRWSKEQPPAARRGGHSE